LEKLPGIGQALAARIVEHRQRYGRFRRIEHLLAVRGISERRFRAVSALLTAE
jgi:competence protein ComEA